MTGHIVIRSSPVNLNRRQPLLAGTLTPPGTPSPRWELCTSRRPTSGKSPGVRRLGCVVVCCCCPCVLVEFLVLAVYKVPVAICRRMLRKRRQKMIKKNRGLLQQAAAESSSGGGSTIRVTPTSLSDVDFKEFETVKVSIDGSAEAVELDKQMWDQFNSTGFWRSPSQRTYLID